MTPEQEHHLGNLKSDFCRWVDAKYRRGAQEHGGCLIDMPALQLLDSAIDEAIDQVTYLLTLRQKMTGGEIR